MVAESGRVGLACSLINASALAKPYRSVPTVSPPVSVRHPGPPWPLSCSVGSKWKESKVGLTPPFLIAMFLALLGVTGAKESSGQGTFFWDTSPVYTGPLVLGS